MLAVIAHHQQFDADHYAQFECELAAINYANNFVVSGSINNIRQLALHFDQSNIINVLMPVEYAFHSQMMEPIRERYLEAMKSVTFQALTTRMISCWRADEQAVIDHQYFWDVIRRPFYFGKAVKFLEDIEPFNYVDLSPSGALANLVKYNLIGSSSQSTFVATM